MELQPGGDDPMRPNNHKINEGANKATLVPRQYENHPDSVEYDRTPLSYRYLTRLFPDGIGDALYPYQFQHLYQQHRPPPILAEEWRLRDDDGIQLSQPNPDNPNLAPHVMLVNRHFRTYRNTQTGPGPNDVESIIARDHKAMCSIQ